MTGMELLNAIKKRWSPRAFSEKKITDEMLESIFEAARWAPSAMNEQPWQYYYARQNETKSFETFVGFLNPGNQVWAKFAQVLIVSVAKKNFDYQGAPNTTALHDLGAANVLLALQAAELGFQAHQMGGFDKGRVLDFLKLDPANYETATMIAVGFAGNPDSLPESLKARELLPRIRKPLSEFVSRIKDS
jgi:nitroreductase